MNNIKLIFILLLFSANISYSQENAGIDSTIANADTTIISADTTAIIDSSATEQKDSVKQHSNIEENEELNTEVVIVKTFKPILFDIDRTPEIPTIIDTVNVNPKFKYFTDVKQIATDFQPEIIQAGKMGNEPLDKIYHSYMRLGIGNHATPLAEIYFNTLRAKKYSIGANAKHLASYGTIKNAKGDKVYSGFDNNYINLFGKKILNKKVLYSDINFTSNELFYFGTDTSLSDIPTEKQDLSRQHFINANAIVGIKTSNTRTKKLNYDVNLKYNYFADKKFNYENIVILNSNVSKYYKKELIGIDTRVSLIDKSYGGKVNSLITATPWASRVTDKWKAKIGLNVNIDVTTTDAPTYFSPNFLLQYNIVGNILIPYIGANGGVKENNYTSISLDNNFVSPIYEIKNTIQKKHFFGGIKGSVSSKISFNAMLAYDDYKNMVFYVNNKDDNKFHIEAGDLHYYNLYSEIRYLQSNKLNISLSANYYYYDYVNIYNETENFNKAWQKPDYSVKLSTMYNLKNKIYLHSDITVMGNRYAKVYKNLDDNDESNDVAYAKRMKEIIDINLGIEYRYSKVLSGFINFNNIAAQKYELWNNYPVHGFQVIGGITYTL